MWTLWHSFFVYREAIPNTFGETSLPAMKTLPKAVDVWSGTGQNYSFFIDFHYKTRTVYLIDIMFMDRNLLRHLQFAETSFCFLNI